MTPFVIQFQNHREAERWHQVFVAAVQAGAGATTAQLIADDCIREARKRTSASYEPRDDGGRK